MTSRQLLWISSLATAVLLAVGSPPGRAAAHAAYERSNPPADGRLRAAPARLDVWFTQELFRRAGSNGLAVIGPTGDPVHVGEATIDDADRKHLSVELAGDLPPGEYTVRWSSLSATDGDTAAGSFVFTVDPSASDATPTPGASRPVAPTDPTALPGLVPSPDQRSQSTDFPWWAVGVAAAILMSGGIAAATILRGERSP